METIEASEALIFIEAGLWVSLKICLVPTLLAVCFCWAKKFLIV